jgi:hypothetical protein
MNSPVISSVKKRLFYAFGTMFAIIAILILAILLFVSFGSGPSLPRGITGVLLTILTFVLVFKSMNDEKSAVTSWIGIISGMTAWMVIGEISHQFGFVKIEAEGGLILLLFTTVIMIMAVIKIKLPWGFRVFLASFMLNWWGHALLLPQLFLAEFYNAPIFETTYNITGWLCLHGVLILVIKIIRRPADKALLIYYGLLLYALLVTGIEGVTNITGNTFGH